MVVELGEALVRRMREVEGGLVPAQAVGREARTRKRVAHATVVARGIEAGERREVALERLFVVKKFC